MNNLVVDLFIEVFDKNIALTGLAEGGIALRPHDPAENPREQKQSL